MTYRMSGLQRRYDGTELPRERPPTVTEDKWRVTVQHLVERVDLDQIALWERVRPDAIRLRVRDVIDQLNSQGLLRPRASRRASPEDRERLARIRARYADVASVISMPGYDDATVAGPFPLADVAWLLDRLAEYIDR